MNPAAICYQKALSWQLAHCGIADISDPQAWERLDWRDTAVPSNVQLSPFGFPADKLYASNRIEEVSWMNNRYWLYRTSLQLPDITNDEEALLIFQGVDYACSVYVDGRHALDHEGMFSGIEVRLPEGDKQTGSTLRDIVVLIHPFVPGAEPYETLKARYGMGKGWDFAPQLAPLGIWDDVSLVVRPKLRIASVYTQTSLANQQRAEVTVFVELSAPIAYGMFTVRLDGHARQFPLVNAGKVSLPLAIKSPRLWWPNGCGAPSLVQFEVELEADGHVAAYFAGSVGLRSVEQVPCRGQGLEDTPLQLRINGRSLFIKGVNWVPADACPASMTPERYRLFLEKFQEAGVNLVRVWGGGLREKSAFYEIADELGLMIIQEFPLACQIIARTERFYKLLAREGEAIIRSLRHHPSVVVWSGGNEHYHYWDAVDSGTETMERTKPVVKKLFGIEADNREWVAGAAGYDEPALSLLGELCARHDGTRPYRITSALEGEGEVHGIWNWNPRIGDHRYRDYASLYDFWLQAGKHLYSEASVSSIANMQTIRDVLEEQKPALPVVSDPVWRQHHAFAAAWDGLDDLWLDLPSTAALFGPPDSLEELVFANQWMQAEGCRFMIEELRRKTDTACGIIWWGVNEPWPGLAGNALIDYYGRPKLGWSFLKNAFRPTILTLRYGNCITRAVKSELWICHDGADSFSGSYEIRVTDTGSGEQMSYEGAVHCGAGSAQYIKTLPRNPVSAGSLLHIRCRLFATPPNEVHCNDYIFGPAGAHAPLGGGQLQYMRNLFQTFEGR